MRTITAPGVEWKEIDRSGYSPAMTGTACYVRGFANKGEPYKPMEFTSRSAWLSYYGEPDNEAERYFYAAACEVLNQNGRLYCARLPYDNDAFEKMVGISFEVNINKTLQTENPTQFESVVQKVLNNIDKEIQEYVEISRSDESNVITYDLSAIDEYRTNEKKVPHGTFLIVDTTGGTYGKVVEDTRKGERRECIGIVPIVTTALNAMQAQSLINFVSDESEATELLAQNEAVTTLNNLSAFEVINGNKLFALSTEIASELHDNGILNSDSSKIFNTNEHWYKQYFDFETKTFKAVKGQTDLTANANPVKVFDGKNWSDLTLSSSTGVNVLKRSKNGATVLSAEGTTTETNGLLTIQVGTSIQNFNNVFGFYLSSSDETACFIDESTIKTIKEGTEDYICGQIIVPKVNANKIAIKNVQYHGVDGDDSIPNTLALDANQYFATLQPASDGIGLDPEHLKDIGVIVYKAYLDPAAGNKVSFEAVESYCGSLFKDDVDPNTGVTKFIDTIINSQSQYINFFSNCFSSSASKQFYKDKCDILIAKPYKTGTLGFFSRMTREDISVSKSIYDGINKSFDKVTDLNLLNIDIVCDAGIANIASYLNAIFGGKGPYDLTITDDLGNSMLGLWTCKKSTDSSVKTWKTVEQKYDTFCKNVRKDCMFIADGLRPLVLQGDKKIIRDSKPANTIDANIIPYFPAICGLNTSYGAGYIDWFEQADDYSGDFFWCPPSIKAMGVYINTDVNFNYWDAPAGLNRGMIAATDVAFSPTPKQAGAFYEKNWNYAINYPNDGIILEGQKTFQVKPSAFDRVNVRRLFLRLERASYQVARYFVYEGNTAYTRQRLVDALDPYFKEAKLGGGVYDYKIICDESINDPTTIDRNELKVKIGIKPVKTAEFIMLDFIAGSTGASWEEIMQ